VGRVFAAHRIGLQHIGIDASIPTCPSFQVVSSIGLNLFTIHISNALILAYEDSMRRTSEDIGLSSSDVDTILAYICAYAVKVDVRYRIRPFLIDANDDMAMEATIAGHCDTIETHNLNDFHGIERFGLRAIRPGKLLRELGLTS
jgi:hypothetical protein